MMAVSRSVIIICNCYHGNFFAESVCNVENIEKRKKAHNIFYYLRHNYNSVEERAIDSFSRLHYFVNKPDDS